MANPLRKKKSNTASTAAKVAGGLGAAVGAGLAIKNRAAIGNALSNLGKKTGKKAQQKALGYAKSSPRPKSSPLTNRTLTTPPSIPDPFTTRAMSSALPKKAAKGSSKIQLQLPGSKQRKALPAASTAKQDKRLANNRARRREKTGNLYTERDIQGTPIGNPLITPAPKKGRGRPKGSKNKNRSYSSSVDISNFGFSFKKKRK